MARPRKPGERYACGKLKPEQVEPFNRENMTSEARDIYEPGKVAPVGKARVRQSILDRLHEVGELNDEQHKAGVRYASLVFAYRKLVIAAPRPTVAPRSLQGFTGGGRVESGGDDDWERLNRLRGAYDAIWLNLVSGPGRPAIKLAVDQLCVANELPHSIDLAREGLDIIRNKS
jgi:hypothetical protein